MGNCVGREASASGGLTRSSLSLSTSSSTSSRDSMELVESRRQQEEARALEGRPHPEGGGPCATPEMDAAFAEAFGAGARPQDYSDIKKNLAKRGTLAFGAAKKQSPSPRGSFEHEEKMPLQTLKMGKRRRNLFSGGSKGDDGDEGGDMELGESSQLEFQKVLRMWQEEKRRRKKESRRGASFLKKLVSKADAKAGGGKKKKKKEKLMMWETFLHSKHVTTDNPAWRHAQQTYSSTRVQEKVEYLFASIDTNGVGFLEKHEFMFMLDGLRGRMHHFLRNTKALYFRSPDQDEVVPADQEFVLSEDFKNSLVGAIQSELFTWRATPHAWAVDKDLFENLVTLIFCRCVCTTKSPISTLFPWGSSLLFTFTLSLSRRPEKCQRKRSNDRK